MRPQWVELILQHQEMGKREQASEGEEVSVEDEENGRGSICEAAGGNCELGLKQIGKIVICLIKSPKNIKKLHGLFVHGC